AAARRERHPRCRRQAWASARAGSCRLPLAATVRLTRGLRPSRGPVGGRDGGEIGIGFGQVPANCGTIIGGQDADTICLEPCAGRARCFGGRIERPAEVLARVTSAPGEPVGGGLL